MSTFEDQFSKIKTAKGFISALDQSGGSTPKALKAYGVEEDEYSNEDEMFRAVHTMRTRIITSPGFSGERIIGAILFENTLDRQIEGKPTSEFLWEEENVVPFLKIDKGLADEDNGVQLMKPMEELDSLLAKAVSQSVFGTKMRSVIKLANEGGIKEIVAQQFEVARQIMSAGLVPIIEPEIDIHSSEKTEAEVILKRELLSHLDTLNEDQFVMLKLTLPEESNFYTECISHKNVLRAVALSGGYTREEANKRLSENNDMIASFSRALSEGLRADQTDEEFNTMIDNSIESIYQASIT